VVTGAADRQHCSCRRRRPRGRRGPRRSGKRQPPRRSATKRRRGCHRHASPPGQ